MSANHDLIAVVEACYQLAVDEGHWLHDVGAALLPVLGSERPLIAYHLDVSERFGVRTPLHLSADGPVDSSPMVAVLRRMDTLLERKSRNLRLSAFERLYVRLVEAVLRGGLQEPSTHLLGSERHKWGPSWMYSLAAPGVQDQLYLVAQHLDGHGATVFASPLYHKRKLTPAERTMYYMLCAHITSGLRLRRRLPELGGTVSAPVGGAVLDAAARVLHADGAARERTECLQAGAREVDAARCKKSGRHLEALAVWQGLLDGQWSLVEQYDSDGKRFILAHRNEPEVRDPRGLTPMEVRVTGLAVRGYSNKLIGYHLGIAEGTASFHLARAMRKLGIRTRVELVRVLGTRYPEMPPARCRVKDATLPLPEGIELEQLGPDVALLSFPVPKAQLHPVLTEAEQDIVLRVYAGETNREIAEARAVRVKTIGNQLERIFRKLGVNSRAELVLLLQGRARP